MSQYQLLSDDPQTMASGLLDSIIIDKASEIKSAAREGRKYYNGKHDILNRRIFYLNDDGELVEDKFASNAKIPHQFFTEQVDQKTQYMLSNPIEFEVEDETFQKYLDEYIDDEFQLSLQESAEGASKKGFEYIFARTTDQDRLKIQVADSMYVFPIFDYDNQVKRICRYYDKDVIIEGQVYTVQHAEIWDEKQVWFFKTSWNNPNFQFDQDRPLNPRPHIIGISLTPDDMQQEQPRFQRTYGMLPFYRLQNNLEERTDLAPIKALIDDYDLMAASLSNNLQDFQEAIYAVKGFDGDDLASLRQNLKAKKVISMSENGGLDIKTVQIPTEARKQKMDVDKESIYRFGMAFDSTQVGDGNITNIVIKMRLALLNMKCNKFEIRMRAMLSWVLDLIVADINRLHNTAYQSSDIEVEFTREAIANDTDIANNAKIGAETKLTMIQAILSAAPKLDNDSVIKLICEEFELDYDEVKAAMDTQDYQDITQGTESVQQNPNSQAKPDDSEENSTSEAE